MYPDCFSSDTFCSLVILFSPLSTSLHVSLRSSTYSYISQENNSCLIRSMLLHQHAFPSPPPQTHIRTTFHSGQHFTQSLKPPHSHPLISFHPQPLPHSFIPYLHTQTCILCILGKMYHFFLLSIFLYLFGCLHSKSLLDIYFYTALYLSTDSVHPAVTHTLPSTTAATMNQTALATNGMGPLSRYRKRGYCC